MEIKFGARKTSLASPDKPITAKAIKLIWIAMIVSILVYFAVGYIYMTQISHRAPVLAQDVLAKLRLALYLVSLGLLFISIKFSRKANSLFAPKTTQESLEGIHFAEAPSDQPPLPADRNSKTASAYTFLIISWAFVEAIAVFGLVLVFVGGKLPDLYGFCLAAIFLMIINRPKIPDQGPSPYSSITPS